jgi:hypothetical protein
MENNSKNQFNKNIVALIRKIEQIITDQNEQNINIPESSMQKLQKLSIELDRLGKIPSKK